MCGPQWFLEGLEWTLLLSDSQNAPATFAQRSSIAPATLLQRSSNAPATLLEATAVMERRQ